MWRHAETAGAQAYARLAKEVVAVNLVIRTQNLGE